MLIIRSEYQSRVAISNAQSSSGSLSVASVGRSPSCAAGKSDGCARICARMTEVLLLHRDEPILLGEPSAWTGATLYTSALGSGSVSPLSPCVALSWFLTFRPKSKNGRKPGLAGKPVTAALLAPGSLRDEFSNVSQEIDDFVILRLAFSSFVTPAEIAAMDIAQILAQSGC